MGAQVVDPLASLVVQPGAHPDVSFDSFQSLGEPFSIEIDAEPFAFYQLAASSGVFPLDFGDPGFLQMLLLLDVGSYQVLVSGTTDANGDATVPFEIPPQAGLLGAALPLQAWTIAVVPAPAIRFSNARTLVGMP